MNNRKAFIFLLLLTGIIYSNSLLSGFVWDDKPLIIRKQAFFSHPSNVFDLLDSADTDFSNVKTPYYRPLNSLSYMLDHYLWGVHPFWYHLENVLLHVLVVALFYLLLLEVFEDRWLAFFAAVLFAVYPVNAETVDFVSARNTLFCALFSLASLLFLAKGGPKWTILSLVAYFLALLGKEPAVVLPFFLLSMMIAPGGDKFKIKKSVLAGFFAVTGIYFIIRHLVLGAFIAKHGLGFSLSRLELISSVYFEHFKLMFFPFRLNALYTEKTLSFSIVKAVAAGLGVLLLLYASLRRKSPGPIRAGAQWILWGLLPVSNIVKIPSAPVAERFQYTILFGFVLILGYLFEGLHQKKAAAGIAALSMLCVALGARTFERNFVWHDDIKLFSGMICSDPDDATAYYNLGNVYGKSGDLEAAVTEFRTALAKDAGFTKAMVNLGVAYAKEGRMEEAVREFRAATKQDPAMPEAHLFLGIGYEKNGFLKEAASEFMTVLKLDPGNAQATRKLDQLEAGDGHV